MRSEGTLTAVKMEAGLGFGQPFPRSRWRPRWVMAAAWVGREELGH